MLSVTNETIKLNVALLNVAMLSVILLNVVEPSPDLVCLASKPFLRPNTKLSSLFCPIINDKVLIDFHQSKVEGPVGHSLGEDGSNPSLADDLLSGLSKNFLRR